MTDPVAELRRSTPDLLNATLHATARLVLHLTKANELPKGELDRLRKQLKLLIEAIDALP